MGNSTHLPCLEGVSVARAAKGAHAHQRLQNGQLTLAGAAGPVQLEEAWAGYRMKLQDAQQGVLLPGRSCPACSSEVCAPASR